MNTPTLLGFTFTRRVRLVASHAWQSRARPCAELNHAEAPDKGQAATRERM
jgi:hypothetical protein